MAETQQLQGSSRSARGLVTTVPTMHSHVVAGNDKYQRRTNTNKQWHCDKVLTRCECVSSHSVAAIATLQRSAIVRDLSRIFRFPAGSFIFYLFRSSDSGYSGLIFRFRSGYSGEPEYEYRSPGIAGIAGIPVPFRQLSGAGLYIGYKLPRGHMVLNNSKGVQIRGLFN